MLESSKIEEIINKIAKEFNPEKIILFGSYAKGKPQEDSDLDLLIINDSNLPKHKRSFEIQKALKGSKIPLDILVYTSSEFYSEINQKYSFLNSAIQSSKVVYERK